MRWPAGAPVHTFDAVYGAYLDGLDRPGSHGHGTRELLDALADHLAQSAPGLSIGRITGPCISLDGYASALGDDARPATASDEVPRREIDHLEGSARDATSDPLRRARLDLGASQLTKASTDSTAAVSVR